MCVDAHIPVHLFINLGREHLTALRQRAWADFFDWLPGCNRVGDRAEWGIWQEILSKGAPANEEEEQKVQKP